MNIKEKKKILTKKSVFQKDSIHKKGVSVVVGTTLMILLVVVAAAGLWYYVSQYTTKVTNEVNPDCLNVLLDPITCQTQKVCVYESGGLAYKANIAVKRYPGKGDLQGLRFVFEDDIKKSAVADRTVTNFKELETIRYSGAERILIGRVTPKTVAVAAIVGTVQDVCKIYSDPFTCTDIGTPAPTPGYIPGQDELSNFCCQYPWNLTECAPSGTPIGAKAYCCTKIPGSGTSGHICDPTTNNCCINPSSCY